MMEMVAGWHGGNERAGAPEALLPVIPLHAQQRVARLLEILEGWHVCPVTLQAGGLLPLAWEYETGWVQLAPGCDREVTELVNNWLELYYLTMVPEAGIPRLIANRSLKLRRLMRKAYINLPLVLLTVADHAVRLEWAEKGGESADTVQSLYEETRDVFLPLLHMLGLWEMRQPWADCVLRQLHPEQYAILSRTAERYNKDAARYRDELHRRLQDLIAPDDFPFQLKVAHTDAGVLHGHSDIGHSIQERLENLTLDISVTGTADCYRMLAYVHHLGTVVQNRFRDYITAPRPNGYRALQTVIFFNQDTARFRERLIHFRIFSDAMQEVNQRGIIADKLAPLAGHCAEGQSSSRCFWWSQTRQNNSNIELLHTDQPFGPLPGADDQIYLFTPYGEVKSLTAGSNVLDFVYRLHSRQAHHCNQAKVNGFLVPHSEELHNGDLVQLIYDFNFHGPEAAWLNFSHNKNTRKHIRRGLKLGGQANLPPGRLRIERLLDKIRQESGFVVPTPQKERYLAQVAQETGLGDVPSLLRAVEMPVRGIRISPERVVTFILESELYTAVVDGQNRPIIPPDQQHTPEYTRPVLRFCSNCRPTPGSDIALHRRHNRRGEERLVLHRADMAHTCLGPATGRLDRDVQWGRITGGRDLHSNLTVVAADRPGLVGDLLEFVYSNDRIDLTFLMAATDDQGVADIRMTVACDNQEELETLRRQADRLDGVQMVSVWPVIPAQYAHLQTRSQGRRLNPFTINPVTQIGMLYGREEEQQTIAQSLEGDNPEGVIVLHGQRRSGKTSLVRLAHQYVRGAILPIYTDMLPLTGERDPGRLLRHIASGIWNKLRITATDIPAPAPLEQWLGSPVLQWHAWLDMVCEWLHPHRLLLIVDEFNATVSDCDDPRFYEALRGAVLNEKKRLTLLLVTHTSQFYRLPPGHPASLIYGQATPLELVRLPDHSARRLVQEPTRAWLMFSDAIAKRIVAGTDGHPLLINMLCRELVSRADRAGKSMVDSAILQEAERLFMQHGLLHFNFLTEHIGEGDRPIVQYLSDCHKQGQEWVPVSTIAGDIGRSPLPVQVALDALKQNQVVVTRTNPVGQNEARIAVPCFAEWVCDHWVA